MKLWIVYGKKHENTIITKSMLECAQKFEIDCNIYYFEYFSYKIENNEQKLFYKSKEITTFPDLAFIRGYNNTLCSFLEKVGTKFVNSKKGLFSTLDKLESHFAASKLGLKQPKTLYGQLSFDEIKNELDLPFVMKDRFGSKGSNVFLINDKTEFEKIKNQNQQIDYIYQEYIEKSKGKDLRIYFVGDKIAGAIYRISVTDDFRSNISLGATSELALNIPQQIKDSAIKLANYLDLHFCSIDFLVSDDEFLFCETNSNAGYRAFFDYGINLQDMIMDYIKKNY